jgi:hypothetical protein
MKDASSPACELWFMAMIHLSKDKFLSHLYSIIDYGHMSRPDERDFAIGNYHTLKLYDIGELYCLLVNGSYTSGDILTEHLRANPVNVLTNHRHFYEKNQWVWPLKEV